MDHQNMSDPSCKRCGGGGYVLHPNPEARSWVPCDCALPHPVVRALSVLRRLSDGDPAFALAIDELKEHAHFEGAIDG